MAIVITRHSVLARMGSFLRLTRYHLRVPNLDPKETKPLEKVAADVYRRDAASGIIHIEDASRAVEDPARHSLVLVRQLRFSTLIDPRTGDPRLPPLSAGPRSAASGLIYELPAGICEGAEPPLEAFRREVREETGVQLEAKAIKPIGRFWPSPGACSERIHLFYARIEAADLPHDKPIWGLNADEQILRRNPTVRAFLRAVVLGAIQDGKTLAAAEWIRRDPAAFHLSGRR